LPRLDGPLASRLEALFREEESWHPDSIADRLGIPAGEVLAELARLELDGCLARFPGGLYALAAGS
jgi:predicted Rossmann fold nucleotide-binding protein DprA/Smf involved in DNA uptake